MFFPTEYRDIPGTDLLSYVFEHAPPEPSAPIYIDAAHPTNTLSYLQCLSLVRRLVAGLKLLGVKPGDSVAVHAYNSIFYAPLILSIIGVGAVYVGSNPAYTESELAHLFSISDVKFIFSESDLLERVLPASRTYNIHESHIVRFDTNSSSSAACLKPIVSSDQLLPRNLSSWHTLLNGGEQDWRRFSSETISKATVAALLQTSGTTGLPKAASMSNYAFVAQSIIIQDRNPKPYSVRRLLYLPFFHAFAGPLSNIAPLRERIPTYVMRRYDQDLFLDSVRRHDITESHMVNPIALALLTLPREQQARLVSLRLVWTAGAPLGSDLQSRLARVLHHKARVVQVLGMTEFGWATTFHHPERDLSGSCGRLMPNVEAMLKDFNGKEISAEDEKGEVWFRSVSRMIGYRGNEAATRETLSEDGWLRTGDIGFVKEGKWWIIDRAKDMIKVRGWQVSPAELEAVLLSHPFINDAAVLGIDLNDSRGELPRAYIVVDQGMSESLKDEEILSFMSDRLAKYKALTGGIDRVKSIPRGPSGKILKRQLREKAIQISHQVEDNHLHRQAHEVTNINGSTKG